MNGGAEGAHSAAESIGSAALYENPAKAKAAIAGAYDYWSGKLTDHSFQFSLAIIGANWTVYRTSSVILGNRWAVASISVVLVALAGTLISAFAMCSLHDARFKYAEADPSRWQKEFAATSDKYDPWPFTKQIEDLGSAMRWIKLVFPLLGAVLFFVSLASNPAAP